MVVIPPTRESATPPPFAQQPPPSRRKSSGGGRRRRRKALSVSTPPCATSPLRPSSGDARGRSSSRRAETPPSANALDDFSRSCRREASVRRRSAASALDAALRALDLAEGEIAQAREHVETAKAATVKGMTPRTSTGAPSPASRRTLEPRNPLEEAAWRGNFGAVPVRTSSTGSDGTASKAEAKARAAAEELARLKAAAEKRASQKNRRRARRTRSAKAT